MKNKVKNLILVMLVVASFSACDGYLDVNRPSNAVDIENIPMSGLLGPVLLNTVYANYYAELSFGNYTQYFGSYGYGAAGEGYNSATWNNIYTKILPNVRVIRDKADVIGAKHYGAVAKIIEAINIGFAVDNWDKVPYTQASDFFNFPHPQFDEGQEVYAKIITLLNEAISSLESPDPSNTSMGSEDIIYGGDYNKWLRAAYTFKARYQLHTMGNGTAAADVLTSINNGFTSNLDDFQMTFPEGKINPYYSTNILSRSTHNFFRAPCDQLISMMNGTTYPFNSISIDPRLPAIFENEGGGGDPWRGFLQGGTGESSDGFDANTYYKRDGFHTSEAAPLIIITYAEAMFIKAEAAFLANGGTATSTGANASSYTAYQAGISANMSKVGVNGATYIADTAVDVGIGNLMLHHIMKEKYIANIHNTETYNDFRRYNFSPNVFKGLALQIDHLNSEFPNDWVKRVSYPLSEENSNETVVNANKKEPTEKVWWNN